MVAWVAAGGAEGGGGAEAGASTGATFKLEKSLARCACAGVGARGNAGVPGVLGRLPAPGDYVP